MQKASIPKGTRDFTPDQMVRRNYIFSTIQQVFKKYGYECIETPAMENLSTLLGKYGEEGDKLLFKVLDSGDFLASTKKYLRLIDDPKIDAIFNEKLKVLEKQIRKGENIKMFYEDNISNQDLIYDYFLKNLEDLSKSILNIEEDKFDFLDFANRKFNDFLYNFYLDSNRLSNDISEKGLRYDLTVPFARFVVQHRDEITFPFKRYQIQPVWRADRPQKGRYREFYQCDADVIGSDSLLNELELIQIIEEVFKLLKIPVTVKLNNRKILAGIAEVIGQPDKLVDITISIDKMEKIGYNKVIEELKERGFTDDAISKLEPFLKMKGSIKDLIIALKDLLNKSETGLKGVEEAETLFYLLEESKTGVVTEFDLTLARGLNYYTGTIIEVKANELEMGSICGGGRYDDLTGIFGMSGVSGVGISFGADRIYDVLNQLDNYPSTITSAAQILLVNFGEKEQMHCLSLLKQLRAAGVKAELYPDSVKLKKQLSYANNRNISYVLLVGEQEIESGSYTLKNMNTGEQKSLTLSDIVNMLS